jgi:hypothetical protein
MSMGQGMSPLGGPPFPNTYPGPGMQHPQHPPSMAQQLQQHKPGYPYQQSGGGERASPLMASTRPGPMSQGEWPTLMEMDISRG